MVISRSMYAWATRRRLSRISSSRSHCDDAEGGVDLAQAVVVAEPLVGEPRHALAALVAQGAAGGGEGVVVGDDHAAFAGGDLLVGVEGEDAGPAEASRSARSPGATCPPKPFAGVFDQDQLVLLGELLELDHPAGVAEGFDGDDRLGLAA